MNTGSDGSQRWGQAGRIAAACMLLAVTLGVVGCEGNKRITRLTINTEPPRGRVYCGSSFIGTAPVVRYFEVPGLARTDFRTGPWNAFWGEEKTAPAPFVMNVPVGLPEKVVDEKYMPGARTKVYAYSFLIEKPRPAPAPAVRAADRAAPKPTPAAQPPKPASPPQTTAGATPAVRNRPADKQELTSVVVSSEPGDCEVSVNGLLVGTTPSRLKLPEGVHVIEVSKQGYQPCRKELRVYAGSDSVLRVKLEPQ